MFKLRYYRKSLQKKNPKHKVRKLKVTSANNSAVLVAIIPWIIFDLLHQHEGALFKPLSISPTKWSKTLKQFKKKTRRLLPMICQSVSDHFMGLVFKELNIFSVKLGWRNFFKIAAVLSSRKPFCRD